MSQRCAGTHPREHLSGSSGFDLWRRLWTPSSGSSEHGISPSSWDVHVCVPGTTAFPACLQTVCSVILCTPMLGSLHKQADARAAAGSSSPDCHCSAHRNRRRFFSPSDFEHCAVSQSFILKITLPYRVSFGVPVYLRFPFLFCA